MKLKRKNQKLLIIVGVLLLFGGISLAYFVSSTKINGNGALVDVTTSEINGAEVKVEGVLNFDDANIYPGHKNIASVKLTATGDNELIPYNLIWSGTNTINTPLNYTVYKTNDELSVTSTCNKKTQIISGAQALSEECTISNIDKLGTEIASGTINKNETKVTLAKDEFITASPTGHVVYYYVILEYPNLDEPQNYDLEGSIDGEVTVEESNTKPDINILAAYVVQEDGTYKEVENIPQEGYQINQEKSKCSDGANVRWDYDNKELITSNLTKNGTSCYLYFDKLLTSEDVLVKLNIIHTTIISPDFSQTATTNEGVYATEDGMYGGTSYYWRGAVTNNYVKFANFCWRIVRINGDGSIRMIYDGTTCHQNGSIVSESIVAMNQAYTLNGIQDRSEYVGWTYLQGEHRNSAMSSNAKIQTDKWYNENIKNTEFDKNVVDGKFCNDREAAPGYVWSSSPNRFYYAAYSRIAETYKPSLDCLADDIYTLKAGAITADEGMLAGGSGSNNESYYLYNGQNYWTMSPSHWGNSGINMFVIALNGRLYTNYLNSAYGLRPVINLKADTAFSSGNGELNSPYVVEN